jgi:hypothetical protein
VPAAVRAGKGRHDVVVAPALLHPKVGAADLRRPGASLQACEHEEVPKEMSMCTDS